MQYTVWSDDVCLRPWLVKQEVAWHCHTPSLKCRVHKGCPLEQLPPLCLGVPPSVVHSLHSPPLGHYKPAPECALIWSTWRQTVITFSNFTSSARLHAPGRCPEPDPVLLYCVFFLIIPVKTRRKAAEIFPGQPTDKRFLHASNRNQLCSDFWLVFFNVP